MRSRRPPGCKPHVALVDLFLAGESGAEVAEELRRAHPELKVLLISGAGRISPRGGPRRRRLGLRLQGLGRGRRGPGGADGRARQEVFAPAPEQSEVALSPRASARS